MQLLKEKCWSFLPTPVPFSNASQKPPRLKKSEMGSQRGHVLSRLYYNTIPAAPSPEDSEPGITEWGSCTLDMALHVAKMPWRAAAPRGCTLCTSQDFLEPRESCAHTLTIPFPFVSLISRFSLTPYYTQRARALFLYRNKENARARGV